MASWRTGPAAALLAASVLAAACGSDAPDPSVGAPSTSAGPASAPAPASPPTDPAAEAGQQPATDTAPPGSPTDPGPPPADSSVPPPPDPPPGDEPPVLAAGPVGSQAVRYLRPSASERVLVQVLAQDGAAPRASVPERVRQVLATASGKPVSVATGGLDGGARSWTGEALRSLADASSPAQTAEQAVLTLLYLRGGFAENERAVGVAVRGDVAAIFAERVGEASGVLGNRRAVEEAVTMHEVGHLLGLVDLVLDTGRADPEHPGHSPNPDSVMYYAVESTLIGSVLGGGPPRDFDQADLDDLARIRNG